MFLKAQRAEVRTVKENTSKQKIKKNDTIFGMFTRKKVLRLFETDATGVLYFAQQLRMAQETFEEFLEETQFPLGESIEKGEYLLPVVHAEADFLGPIKVGDEIEITLEILQIGTSSLTLGCTFKKNEIVVGTTKIVHVLISRTHWKSIPIPEALRTSLERAGGRGSMEEIYR